MTQGSHAKCSASGSYRWLSCPGSVWACSQVPPSKTTVYAEEGTKAHKLAELILSECQKENWEMSDAWGDKIKAEYSEEMIAAVMCYVEKVFLEMRSFDKTPAIRIETHLTLSSDMKMFGTADCAMTGIINNEPVGVIIDLKYGKVKVVAKDNPQLAYYACAMRKTSKQNLLGVKVIIVQPRIKNPITEISYCGSELNEWEDKLIKGAEKALLQTITPTAREFNIGNYCKWCDGLSVCPAKNKAPDADAGLEFKEI